MRHITLKDIYGIWKSVGSISIGVDAEKWLYGKVGKMVWKVTLVEGMVETTVYCGHSPEEALERYNQIEIRGTEVGKSLDNAYDPPVVKLRNKGYTIPKFYPDYLPDGWDLVHKGETPRVGDRYWTDVMGWCVWETCPHTEIQTDMVTIRQK